MKTIILPGKMMAYRAFIFAFLSCLLQVLTGWAAEVSPEKAQATAVRFLTNQSSSGNSRIQASSLELAYVKRLPGSAQARQIGKPLYYVFNNGEKGFIIISGDDAAYPVLGFSSQGSFDATRLPQAYQKWVARYEKQIKEIISTGATPTNKISQAWQQLGNQRTTTVGPLLTSKWDQSPYHNDLCPYDADAGKHAVTGCVATAMAQIMKYHEHPKKGTGFHSYQHDTYGTLSADFGLATYQWDLMPDVVDGPNEAVALLNFHCGVSVDMDYGPDLSGAAGAVLVAPALQNYFQYEAEVAARDNYTDAEWVNLLQSEIDAGRPMYYEGFGNGSGHAFVCDGYQDDEFFHFNWGWGGMMDGFYYINDLSPSDVGTGGGNGSYNSHQKIVYRIIPKGKEDNNGNGNGDPVVDLQLYSDIQVDPNPIYFANPFTVEVNVANFSTTDFTGKFAAVITNQDNITEVLDSVEVSAMEPQTYYTLTFPSAGIPIAAPGTYYVAIFYKAVEGEWQQVQSDTYASLAEVEILGPDNDIALYEPIELTTDNIVQNEPFGITFNIVNNREEEFAGTLYAALYDLEGYFQALVDSLTIPSLPADYTFVEDLAMNSIGVNLSPGSYLLAVISADAVDTLLLASDEYANPVTVIVQAPPAVADPYENNDEEAQAYVLEIPDDNEPFSIKTTGANQHMDLDYDYYKLTLPDDNEYEIVARVQDSYDSDDGEVYTNDVIFSFKTNDAEWSDAFDTEMENPIVVKGGSVIFWIAPYFAGQQGTYALDIQVNKKTTIEKMLTLSSPIQGVSWEQGTSQTVTWTSNFTGKVNLELYRNAQYLATIANDIDNNGSYTWTLPDTLAQSSHYQVVIYSTADHNVRAISDNFTIDRVTAVPEDISAEVRCFPNPVQDQVSITFGTKLPATLALYSSQGTRLAEIPIQGVEISLDMRHLPAGVYFVQCVWTEEQLTVHKILKQ